MSQKKLSTQLVVIGAGPGGYAAAFRAADLGIQVTLIDLEKNPGGVCTYKGCIPSKALLHAAKILSDAKEAKELGINFKKPKIDLKKLRLWKQKVVDQMTGGLGELCKLRKIQYIQGRASFVDSHTLLIQKDEGEQITIQFDFAVLATGSRPFIPPELNIETPHLWNSTAALKLEKIPKKLLIIGGGYIGLELGTVYAALGSQITLIEMTSNLLSEVDQDLVRPLKQKIEKTFHSFLLEARLTKIQTTRKGLKVTLETSEQKLIHREFEKVLVAIGRKPNSSGLGLQNTKIEIDEKGFIQVNEQRQTTESHIYAIGDLTGNPMLAHKATHEGMIVAEVISGENSSFEPRAIPAVIFTDPEIAWCGLTEKEAKKQNLDIKVSRFPWTISGRATTLNRNEGMTKIMTDPESNQVLGVGIVGTNAGDLISEAALAIEMGAVASDIAMTIHPHPTLSETLMEAAEGVEGSGLHLYRSRS